MNFRHHLIHSAIESLGGRLASLLRAIETGFLVSCLLSGTAVAQHIIVNDGVDLRTIDRNRARLIFTARITQWPDHKPVKVFVLPDDAPLHQDFAKGVLEVYPYQLRRNWDRQVFSGTGQAPVQVSSEQEMIERVGSTLGAIGYIGDQPPGAGIKLVEVESP